MLTQVSAISVLMASAGLDLENDAAAANQVAPADVVTETYVAPLKPITATMNLPQDLGQSVQPSVHQHQPMPVDAGVPHLSSLPHNNSRQIQQQQQQQQPGPRPENGADRVASQQHAKAPANWQSLSDVIIPRASIFYCSSFCSEPGLPKHSKHFYL